MADPGAEIPAQVPGAARTGAARRGDGRRRSRPARDAAADARLVWRWRAARFALLITALLPAVALVLAHRLWVRRKPVPGLGEKATGRGLRCTPGAVLVHGVSLGEVNLMRPLVPRLEAATGVRCILSTSTGTGRARLDECFPGHERVFWPLDLPWAVTGFLRRVRPRAIVLLELEVWPLLLCAAAVRRIPVLLVNARVSERSHRGYRRAGALLRPLFRSLALGLGQNGPWTARLVDLGLERGRAQVTGSMKADMVQPATAAAAAELAGRLGIDPVRPLLLLASTSDGEEEPLLAAWKASGDPSWQVVVCPRHPERGPAVAAGIERIGRRPRRSTAGGRIDDHGDVLVVDEIGRLGALYRLCADGGGIAVVGGSCGSGRGGQNMLEPAAAGCCTVVGWDVRNFPDAMALLRATGGVAEAKDAAALGPLLGSLARDPVRRTALGHAGRSAWQAGRGATDRALAAIARWWRDQDRR